VKLISCVEECDMNKCVFAVIVYKLACTCITVGKLYISFRHLIKIDVFNLLYKFLFINVAYSATDV